MDIKIYIGGHETTTRHLKAALTKNQTTLDSEKIVFHFANEETFINIFKASKAIRSGRTLEDIKAGLLQQLTNVTDPKTLIIIDSRTIGDMHRPFDKEYFYPTPGNLIKRIQSIFDDFNIRLFIESRNPASFIPASYYNMIFSNVPSSFEEFIATINVEELRWSTYIDRAQGRGTQVPTTTWRYEDYAYIWRDVIGALTGVQKYQDFLNPSEQLDFSPHLDKALLLHKYMQNYPVQSDEEFVKLKTLFLERKTEPSQKPVTPRWSQERIQELTYNYDDDWYYIERMDEVKTILPRDRSI